MTLLACVISLRVDEFLRHPLPEPAEEPHQGGVLRDYRPSVIPLQKGLSNDAAAMISNVPRPSPGGVFVWSTLDRSPEPVDYLA